MKNLHQVSLTSEQLWMIQNMPTHSWQRFLFGIEDLFVKSESHLKEDLDQLVRIEAYAKKTSFNREKLLKGINSLQTSYEVHKGKMELLYCRLPKQKLETYREKVCKLNIGLLTLYKFYRESGKVKGGLS